MKAHSYVLGSLLAGALALATVQGREHDGQQTKELWASQTERQGESRPRGTSKTGSQTSAKRAVKQPAQEITLTKDFREAAMLAKLAIEQLQNKMYAGDRIFELYQEEAQKAMTVADAKVRNFATYESRLS